MAFDLIQMADFALAEINAKLADVVLIDTGDARLSDARAPLNYSGATITSGLVATQFGGTGANFDEGGEGSTFYLSSGVFVELSAGSLNSVMIQGATFPEWSTSLTLAGGITTQGQPALVVEPFGASPGETGEIRLLELNANGSDYRGFKSPDDNLNTTIIWTLPDADGGLGKSLTTDGNGVLTFANGWLSTSGVISTPGLVEVRFNPSGAPPGHHVHIRGTTDIIQFKVDGFSSQTASIVQFMGAGGTFNFDNSTGSITLSAGNIVLLDGALDITNSGVPANLHNTTDAASNQAMIINGNTRSFAANNDSAHISFLMHTLVNGAETEVAQLKWAVPDTISTTGRLDIEVKIGGSLEHVAEFGEQILFQPNGTSNEVMRIKDFEILMRVDVGLAGGSNLNIGNGFSASNGTNVLEIVNGTTPSNNVSNTFQVYSDDAGGAGTASMHIRNETGDIIKLFKSAAYTPTNGNTLRTIDFASFTLDELGDLVNTMIADMQATGQYG